MYYSYEVGPAHVIALASFYPGGFGAGSPLTQWLAGDLASIDRAKTPWVFVSLHAPWCVRPRCFPPAHTSPNARNLTLLPS